MTVYAAGPRQHAQSPRAKPLCAVCKHWQEGDVCAHSQCPGRSLSRKAKP